MTARYLLAAMLLAAAVAVAGDDNPSPTPTPLPDAAEASSPHVLLEWSAAREDGVYGYLIYRAERREGPFRRLNLDIVHARPDGPGGVSSYRYVDADVEPGRTYYYYLDTLTMSGLKQRLSGVISRQVAP